MTDTNYDLKTLYSFKSGMTDEIVTWKHHIPLNQGWRIQIMILKIYLSLIQG